MTSAIDLATASQLFDTEVTIRYQNHEYLPGTVEERHGTTGVATNVPVSDQLEMSEGSFAPDDILISQVNDTNRVIVPHNFYLKTAINGGQRTLFAYNTIVDHSKVHAKAIGRMRDYIKLYNLFNAPDFGDIVIIPKEVGANTGINQGKMSAALAVLENAGVDIMNRSCSMWMPATAKPSFFADDRVVNLFYTNNRPLDSNSKPNYLDVDIRVLGAAGINLIPFTTADDKDTYLVPIIHKEAFVQIFNRDPGTSITFVPQNDRYELLSWMTSGGKIIQTEGIVLLEVELPYEANP